MNAFREKNEFIKTKHLLFSVGLSTGRKQPEPEIALDRK